MLRIEQRPGQDHRAASLDGVRGQLDFPVHRTRVLRKEKARPAGQPGAEPRARPVLHSFRAALFAGTAARAKKEPAGQNRPRTAAFARAEDQLAPAPAGARCCPLSVVRTYAIPTYVPT